MAKERLIAIFIGLIMIMSVAGFALMSAMNQGVDNSNKEFNIPAVMTRELTAEETVYVLNYEGRAIMEYFYQENCTDCSEKMASLESFANRMAEFLVLQEVVGNETSLQILGSQGRIVDMSNMTLSEGNLMNTFCDVAIAQPQECLMRE
jgi:hypothetical protein